MRCVILVMALFSCTNSLCQVSDFWNTDFQKADSIALAYAGHDLSHPDQLAEKLTKDLDTEVEKLVEKFRVIFRWITDNISYDYPLYRKKIRREAQLRYNRKRFTSYVEHVSTQMYRRMIRQKKTICSGYARLLEYMCEQAGLQCNQVSGYGSAFYLSGTKGPNHAWNVVKLGDRWYVCDVTWASGYIDSRNERFYKSFNEMYFLTDPSLFISNHYPSDASWILLKDPPSLASFMNAPFKAEGFISNWINQYSPEKGVVRIKTNEEFEFRFTSNASYVLPNARINIVSTKKKEPNELYDCQLTQRKSGEYVLTHTFQKRGSYCVYISINMELTFIYKVAVV